MTTIIEEYDSFLNLEKRTFAFEDLRFVTVHNFNLWNASKATKFCAAKITFLYIGAWEQKQYLIFWE